MVLSVASLLAVLSFAPASDAVELEWTAPPPCPPPEVVRNEIAALLSEAGGEVDGSVRVTGGARSNDDGTWTVDMRLDLDGEPTERTIDGPSCPELASAAAFIVAIAIDPRVAALPPRPPRPRLQSPKKVKKPEPPPEPSPLEPEPRKPEAPPPAPTPEPRRIRLAPGAFAGIGYGPLPQLGAVVGGRFSVLGRNWRVGVLGEYWAPSSVSSDSNEAFGVRVQGWDIGARGCAVPSLGIVEFPLCAGLAGGLLHGRGTGDLRVRSATVGWVRVFGGPGFLVRLGERFAVGARADGYGTIARGAFRTTPSGVVFRPRAGGLTVTGGVEFRLR